MKPRILDLFCGAHPHPSTKPKGGNMSRKTRAQHQASIGYGHISPVIRHHGMK